MIQEQTVLVMNRGCKQRHHYGCDGQRVVHEYDSTSGQKPLQSRKTENTQLYMVIPSLIFSL